MTATKERKENIINLTENFMNLDPEHRAMITGYMMGIEDERKKWETKEDKEELKIS